MKINSSKRFGIIAFIVGVVLTLLLVAFSRETVSLASVKVVNKLFSASIVLAVVALYKHFFQGKTHDTDLQIGKDPVAVAIDCGMLAIAVAIAVSGAF